MKLAQINNYNKNVQIGTKLKLSSENQSTLKLGESQFVAKWNKIFLQGNKCQFLFDKIQYMSFHVDLNVGPGSKVCITTENLTICHLTKSVEILRKKKRQKCSIRNYA
jgi:hypothetical protein